MSNMNIILGQSGSGKTTSLRNLDPTETLLIQVVSKPLPFRSADWKLMNKDNPSGSIFRTDNAKVIQKVITSNAVKEGKHIIIIDDFQYIMANQFFKRSDETGFQKYAEMGREIFDLLNELSNLDDDKIIYLLWHTEEDSQGKTKAKTIGKMLDEKLTIEGLFTSVFMAEINNGEHVFRTKNDGRSTVKTPIGMFDEEHIPNDLKLVTETIRDYYGI